jgi:hypothetical protein
LGARLGNSPHDLRRPARLSRDIDAFIDDPQYLALLSPETTDVWKCAAWDRAAHYLKLKYAEGEIDFLVTAAIISLPPIESRSI